MLERTFAIDILACPECGGRLRLIATITDRAVLEKILRTSAGSLWSAGHLGLPADAPRAAPAHVTGTLPGFETSDHWAE